MFTPVPFILVPSFAIHHVHRLLTATVAYSPSIAALIDDIALPQLLADIHSLTSDDSIVSFGGEQGLIGFVVFTSQSASILCFAVS